VSRDARAQPNEYAIAILVSLSSAQDGSPSSACLRSLSLLSCLLSGLVAPMSIDHGSKVTPIKAGPMAELAAMREQYANSGGVPPPPGAPTLPGEGHHCSARVLLSCGASQARAWLS
jgi:hypothetical protein